MSGEPGWTLRSERLALAPVSAADADELVAFHADPRVMRTMRHGVLDAAAARALIAGYAADWPARGWGVRVVRRAEDGAFVGICGLWLREDGRGVALRFAIVPEAQGLGYAREAARATVADAFARLGLARVVSVARDDNLASRRALAGAGFALVERFENGGEKLGLYAVERDGAAGRAALSSASARAAGGRGSGR